MDGRFAFAAFALLLAGCSTNDIRTDEARPVALDTSGAAVYSTARELSGHITVKRDTGFLGSAVPAHVLVDGHDVALLAPGEKVDFWLEPGRHLLGMRFVLGTERNVVINVTERDEQIYRVTMDFNGPALSAAAS